MRAERKIILKGKKIGKIVIVLSGLVLISYLIIELIVHISLVTDPDLNHNKYEICLYDGYIWEHKGIVLSMNYILVNDNNISDLFRKAGSEIAINSVEDFEQELKKRVHNTDDIEVIVNSEKSFLFKKKENFQKMNFGESTDDIWMHYTILKSGEGEYYINFEGKKFTDNGNYNICTGKTDIEIVQWD